MLPLMSLRLGRTSTTPFSPDIIVYDADDVEFGTLWWFVYAGISCFLVLFAGIMSGLTLGLMSLGLVDLEILQRSGTSTEKKQAAAILPVVQKQHQLLVTLLLCNACAMEALPIYLDKIFHPFVAVLLSVTFVLAFGEVIPQAICSRFGLYVGANFVWLVHILMIICYPIAYPIGKVLDAVLGHNDALFRRAQLKALVSIHSLEAGKGGELTHDETTIISGALDLTEKTAKEAMTPIESTFSLDVDSKLDWEAMGKILARGHSRVPVFSGSPKNIIGLLLVKNLLTVRAETETPVSAVSIRRIPRVPSDMPLYDILNEFQKGSSHMAAVVKTKKESNTNNIHASGGGGDNGKCNEGKVKNNNSELTKPLLSESLEKAAENVVVTIDKPPKVANKQQNGATTYCVHHLSDNVEDGEVIGIITLEDVFEELLQEEIVDETDVYIDVHRRIRVAAAAAASSVARAPSSRKLAGHKTGVLAGRMSLSKLWSEYFPIMGFNSVYRCLQDIFPQVDARILRAVAIEHPKDVDLAAGIVITEVIPFMSKRSMPSIPAHDKSPGAVINVEDERRNRLEHEQLVEKTDVPCSVPVENIKNANCSNEEQHLLGNGGENFTGEATDKITENTTNGLAGGSFAHELERMDVESENLFSSVMCQEVEPEQTPLNRQTASTNNSNGKEVEDFDGPAADDNNDISSPISYRFKNYETALVEGENSVVESVNQAQKHFPNAKECSFQSEFVCGPSISADKNLESGCSFFEQEESVNKAGDVEDEISENDVVSESNQLCRIDLLEKVIDEAKTNKRSLFTSMESLISLMREVELLEKAAEQAKMEAALGGEEILVRVEELKEMLVHAKEANDMHAGEVYGEKAILATEMKELQSRLLSLSDERDNSLAILDEMSQTLEVRLAAAEEMRKAAEQEKLEKEESARKALVEQEAIMEKVVQESTKLQLEAEENSKLREFLIDRGRVVDMLQGEISVICQDIRLLKEKFDANLPLSKSLTSSQTSCILASSGSSHKSLASDIASDHGDLPEILKTKPVSLLDELSSKSRNEEESSKSLQKTLLDDGWDYIVENDIDLNS
ncbi:DUF21 domain-containing protein [Senna tora]|uniref:DUF21 domain-containing protein n=1 Tax=Senna tora TaxID=362788 RepID=A0A834WES9_9FABA|nr:DUF21 domain-containing protein [Senna tora]